MSDLISEHVTAKKNQAFEVLRRELKEFNHDGLVQLSEDLRAHAVIRGSWAGCVLSYRRGEKGSACRDSHGAARNDFTVLWDNAWIEDSEVLQFVEYELIRREAEKKIEVPMEMALA